MQRGFGRECRTVPLLCKPALSKVEGEGSGEVDHDLPHSRHPHDFSKGKIVCGVEDPRFDMSFFQMKNDVKSGLTSPRHETGGQA